MICCMERDVLRCSCMSCAIYDHASTAEHHTKLDNFSLVERESHTITRTIKEAMFIGTKDPSLNRYISKYQLSHIWDEIMCVTSLAYTSNILSPSPTRSTAQDSQNQLTSSTESPHTVSTSSTVSRYGVPQHFGTRYLLFVYCGALYGKY